MFVRRTISPSVYEEIVRGDLRARGKQSTNVAYSASLKMRICTSFAMVRFLKPRFCMRWTKSGVILKMRIWMSSSSVGWKPRARICLHFVGVDSLDLEGDELVGVGQFVSHGCEALRIGGIDVEDAQGDEVVDGDAADVGLLKRAGEVACDVEKSVGLKLLRIVAGEAEFGHAIDEGGVGREESVAGEFAIVHCASTCEGAGLGSEGCGEVGAFVAEIGKRDAGEAAHRFIAEAGAAMVAVGAVCVADVETEFAGRLR